MAFPVPFFFCKKTENANVIFCDLHKQKIPKRERKERFELKQYFPICIFRKIYYNEFVKSRIGGLLWHPKRCN